MMINAMQRASLVLSTAFAQENFSWSENFSLDFFGDLDFATFFDFLLPVHGLFGAEFMPSCATLQDVNRFLKTGQELYSSEHLGRILRHPAPTAGRIDWGIGAKHSAEQGQHGRSYFLGGLRQDHLLEVSGGHVPPQVEQIGFCQDRPHHQHHGKRPPWQHEAELIIEEGDPMILMMSRRRACQAVQGSMQPPCERYPMLLNYLTSPHVLAGALFSGALCATSKPASQKRMKHAEKPTLL